MFNPARARALLFDVDGTLRDTDDLFVDSLAKRLQPFRLILPKRDPRAFARRLVMLTENPATLLMGIPDRLGLDNAIAGFWDLFYTPRKSSNHHSLQMIEGVREMLVKLHQRYPLAVVSARGHRGTQAFLDWFDLAPFFDCVVTGQTCRYTKPHPDPILWAAAQLEVAPEDCVMIGDTTVDIQSGKAAGTQTIGVLCGFGTEDELRYHGADLILRTTPELAALL